METLREPRRRANTPFVIKEPKAPYYDAEPPPPPQSPAAEPVDSRPTSAPSRALAPPGSTKLSPFHEIHEISTRSPHDLHVISKMRTPISWRPAADLQGLSCGERLAFMGSCSSTGSDHPMRIETADGFAVMRPEAAGANPAWRG